MKNEDINSCVYALIIFIIYFSVWIICQTTGGDFVKYTTVHAQLLHTIQERAKYNDGDFPEISRHLVL